MNCPDEYISVAVALPVFEPFVYRVPPHLKAGMMIGKRLLVPFGPRRVTGFALGKGDKDLAGGDIRDVEDILDPTPLFPETMLPFFKWIADYYLHPIGEVIMCALPGGLNACDRKRLSITENGRRALSEKQADDRCLPILIELAKKDGSFEEIRRKTDRSLTHARIQAMEANGWISVIREMKSNRVGHKTERFIRLLNPEVPKDRFHEKRKAIVDALRLCGEMSMRRLCERIPDAKGFLKKLADKGNIRIETRDILRDPLGDPVDPDAPPAMTEEQHHAVEQIEKTLGKGFHAFLLSGVTGSGKTEVYMRLAAVVISTGASVLVLVPEIALISQTAGCFRARFGDSVAVLHSGLSAGERYDQWKRILSGAVRIVIGARSAIFAPLEKPGLIIVDEEHDLSYKQETGLRYNARDLGVLRARMEGAVTILGSATPSVQSRYNADNGKFVKIDLTHRVNRQPLPEMTIVDLRQYRDQRGIHRLISPDLRRAIAETLSRNDQALLFLNRRGFATYPVCADCGEVVKCPNCDISLTLHQGINAYVCHFCGHSRASVSACRACGSTRIQKRGFGTEKLEESVGRLFPEARIARLDRDATRRKGDIVRILQNLRNRSIDILVGTQMIAKGHDFPHVTLVGIVCADLSLNFPDFRAVEQTFHVLAQVSGRAGRGERPGRVILQTYTPDHFSIRSARTQDYEAFYEREIGFRRDLKYPPFSKLIQLKLSGPDKIRVEQCVREIGELCRVHLAKNPPWKKTIEIMGPIQAPFARIAGQHRWQILLKGAVFSHLHGFVRHLLNTSGKRLNHRDVKTVVDVDPYFML